MPEDHSSTLSFPDKVCESILREKMVYSEETAWPSGQRFRLAIRRSRVSPESRIPLW